jgi:hypothetical protein
MKDEWGRHVQKQRQQEQVETSFKNFVLDWLQIKKGDDRKTIERVLGDWDRREAIPASFLRVLKELEAWGEDLGVQMLRV